MTLLADETIERLDIFVTAGNGRYHLGLHRTQVELVKKRVRRVGTLAAPSLISADCVAAT